MWWWLWEYKARIIFTLVIGAIFSTLIAMALNSPPPPNPAPDTESVHGAGDHFWQDLGDGSKVQCWYMGQGWGTTCDWVAYHERLHGGTAGH